jgi:hypothetical protein
MPQREPGQAGVIGLPSGRLLRERGLRAPVPSGPEPEFGLYLQPKRPTALRWPSRWVHRRDVWVPADPDDTRDALVEVWQRAETQRVEIACRGGEVVRERRWRASRSSTVSRPLRRSSTCGHTMTGIRSRPHGSAGSSHTVSRSSGRYDVSEPERSFDWIRHESVDR